MAMLSANVGGAEADVGFGGGLLDTSSRAGMATITALVAAALLLFLVGRGEGGLRRVLKVAEFIFIIGMAEIVWNYLIRAWSDQSDSALADGLDYND